MAGSAEATGLPDECADIVTASQAMHWFDAERALPEVVRILRPGGIFAAYDYDWPPCIDWETDAVYQDFERRVTELEAERGLRPPHAGKQHLERIEGSGRSGTPGRSRCTAATPGTSSGSRTWP